MKKKLSHFIVLFTIFLSFFWSTQSLTSETKASWAINEDIKRTLANLSSDEVLKALSDFNIEASFVQPQQFIEQYKISEGRYFTLYLAPRAFHEDQVWILAHENTPTHFEDLSIDQLSELESFRYLMGEVYFKSLKYKGYVNFIDTKKNYGLNRPVLCLEMLPASYKGKNQDQVDILEKLERVWYVLFGSGGEKLIPPHLAKAKIESIQNFINAFKRQGISLAHQKRIEKNTSPWFRRLAHLGKLKEFCLNEFHGQLIKKHDLFENDPFKSQADNKDKPLALSNNEGEFTQVDEEELEIKTCAFCNPKVIHNQHVYTKGDFVGLYNFRPYILGYHFLITLGPTHHVEDWQHLSLQDTLEMDQLAQAFMKAIQKESKRDDIILFVQNGFAAGMTVPHCHMHVLLRPTKFHLISMNLIEVAGRKFMGLTPEEMEPTKQTFNKLVGQFIQ